MIAHWFLFIKYKLTTMVANKKNCKNANELKTSLFTN